MAGTSSITTHTPTHYASVFSVYSLDTHPQSAAMPAPTLEFSAVCLKNALFLLSCFTTTSSSICPTLPGPPIQGEAITSLRCAPLLHALVTLPPVVLLLQVFHTSLFGIRSIGTGGSCVCPFLLPTAPVHSPATRRSAVSGQDVFCGGSGTDGESA